MKLQDSQFIAARQNPSIESASRDIDFDVLAVSSGGGLQKVWARVADGKGREKAR